MGAMDKIRRCIAGSRGDVFRRPCDHGTDAESESRDEEDIAHCFIGWVNPLCFDLYMVSCVLYMICHGTEHDARVVEPLSCHTSLATLSVVTYMLGASICVLAQTGIVLLFLVKEPVSPSLISMQYQCNMNHRLLNSIQRCPHQAATFFGFFVPYLLLLVILAPTPPKSSAPLTR